MVKVDQSLCTGCGICIEACPEVFTTGEDGKAVAVKQESSSGNLEAIADLCPVDAIEV